MTKKASKYQIKKVSFQNGEMELYSLDGHTWSSRKEELAVIEQRREDSKVSFDQIRSGNFRKKKKVAENEEENKQTSPKQRASSKKSVSSKKEKSKTKKA